MQPPPISQDEIDSRIRDHLDELLGLWQAEQGNSKPRDLELMATVIPLARDRELRALDLCCGPGDAGRAIRRVYRNAEIDCVDRDPFLTAICRRINARERIPGRIAVHDLGEAGWPGEFGGSYDVIAVVNALHWFDRDRASELLGEVYRALHRGGVFLMAEPVSPEESFARGFGEWKARQPQRYSQENWIRFWSRANALLGYDHIKLLGSRDAVRIGDELSVAGWSGLVESAGFGQIDVLLRDADQVIIAARKET